MDSQQIIMSKAQTHFIHRIPDPLIRQGNEMSYLFSPHSQCQLPLSFMDLLDFLFLSPYNPSKPKHP